MAQHAILLMPLGGPTSSFMSFHGLIVLAKVICKSRPVVLSLYLASA